jgi:chemotaxis protein CheX
MDVRFINPFILAVRRVFQTMLATEVKVGRPNVITTKQESLADVSAVIGLSGDVVGCVILSLPMPTAEKAGSKFAGIELTRDHPDFADALGELANMVAGQAKAQFEGMNVSISLPSVIVGPDHVVSQSRQWPRLHLPCESPLGTFTVEVAMIIEKHEAGPAQPFAAAAASV